MTEQEKKFISQWLTKANEDYEVIMILSKEEFPLNAAICFHCQQATEKFLKAFLIYRFQEVEKTHDIEFLQDLCCKLDSDFCSIDVQDINQFAVRARYPDDTVVPSNKETKIYIDLTIEVKILVEKKIRL